MTLNEVEKIYDSVSPRQINLKSFETKETLNPKLWKAGRLNYKIRQRLLTIAMDFYDSLDIDILLSDIILVGSSASYNWSKYSDIDLHLVIDFSKIDKNSELLKKYFNSKKNDWNREHDIQIMGYDIEVYVQDINEANASDGVYSLVKNQWIQIPTSKNLKLNKTLISQQAAYLINRIDRLAQKTSQTSNIRVLKRLYNIVNDLYKNIIHNRREGLNSYGESAVGNIVFKVLRRSEHLAKLRNLKTIIYDKIESIK